MRNLNHKTLRLTKQGLIEYQSTIKTTTDQLDQLVSEDYKKFQNDNEAWLVRDLYHWLRLNDSDGVFFVECVKPSQLGNIILSQAKLYHFLTILLLVEYILPVLQETRRTDTVKSGVTGTRLRSIKAAVKEILKGT